MWQLTGTIPHRPAAAAMRCWWQTVWRERVRFWACVTGGSAAGPRPARSAGGICISVRQHDHVPQASFSSSATSSTGTRIDAADVLSGMPSSSRTSAVICSKVGTALPAAAGGDGDSAALCASSMDQMNSHTHLLAVCGSRDNAARLCGVSVADSCGDSPTADRVPGGEPTMSSSIGSGRYDGRGMTNGPSAARLMRGAAGNVTRRSGTASRGTRDGRGELAPLAAKNSGLMPDDAGSMTETPPPGAGWRARLLLLSLESGRSKEACASAALA